ncbi:uncharacterized protein LOC133185017 [Saccostrea echinata]|uniref:uncharacterized protein LOC133185017 n=1 Tax=Saccostrea echinata TaxID=191078 RepID=UPI002A81F0E2|nr:uncharacterized protein LOC133185017 [Saccostrea echinata]
MDVTSLEFLDPSGLSDIETNLKERIQKNENLLERKSKHPKRSINIFSELEEFRPSVFEREMENLKPCIEETSKYLADIDRKQADLRRKFNSTHHLVKKQEVRKKKKLSLDEETSVSYPIELIEKEEAVRVCLGKCLRQIQIERVDDINPGDHLVYQRPGYQHHAIVVNIKKVDDITADITVIHKSGDGLDVVQGLIRYVLTIGQSSPKGRLKEETFESVNVTKSCLFIVKYKTNPYSPDQIIKRAREQLDKSKSSEYNLANNNCEHIVTWCVTGEWYSDQINSLWINVMNKFKPFCEDTASLEKVEDMRRCELICDECYLKCKTKKTD